MRRPWRAPPASYAEQTYDSPYAIVRLPHRQRYRAAVSQMLAASPQSVLDYGAGDGRLLVEAIECGLKASHVVAFEPVESYAELLRSNLAGKGLTDRVEVVRDRDELGEQVFDFVACLGVLEHMPLAERIGFYDLCEASSTERGPILIDVPVEYGPSLLIKNLARRMLKARPLEYRPGELARLAVGGMTFDPARFDPEYQGTWIHDHKGFDHRLLRAELERRFELTAQMPTPFPRLPAAMGNQEVLFTVRRRVG